MQYGWVSAANRAGPALPDTPWSSLLRLPLYGKIARKLSQRPRSPKSRKRKGASRTPCRDSAMQAEQGYELRSRIFGGLPPDLFRVFSGDTRWLYADLLEHIDRSVFGDVPGIISRTEMLDAIREFLDRSGRGADLNDSDQATTAPAGADARAFAAYRRLVDTGWLTEFRDRYRRIVDINANARLVLATLLEIKAGRTRSYGGEVLQVLLQLEGADKDPENRSEAIRNAERSARSFMHHLRSISSAVRQIEEELVGQTDMRTLFRKFFEDFVEQFLIADFKRLKSTTNPFRFRRKIIDTAENILGNELRMVALADSYVREGRGERTEDAYSAIAQELRIVIAVFEGIGDYLEIIEGTNQRLERRISNTVRFMDRIAETRTERVIEAIAKVGSLQGELSAELDVPHNLLSDDPVSGREDLYQPKRPREAIKPQKIRRRAPDPAFLAYRSALDAYRLRTTVTAAKMASYLTAALGDRKEAGASELPLLSLDDFFIFERLRTLQQLDDGGLTSRFEIEVLTGTFENEWISCPNFRIRRLRKASSHVGA